MTSTEMHLYFDILTDKYGSPYFPSSEKDVMLNAASIEYVKDMLPSNEGGVVNFEFDAQVYNNIYPLVFVNQTRLQDSLTSDNSGSVFLLASILTSLRSTSGDSTCDILFFGSLSVGDGGGVYYPCKFTRINDFDQASTNSFKSPTITYPRYILGSTAVSIYPAITGKYMKYSVIKTPKKIAFGVTDSDLPSHTHKAVVEKAVRLAAEGMRDGDLAQLNSLK